MSRSVLLTRRGLLQAGLLGSAAVWAGGLVGCATRRPVPAPSATPRAALSPEGEQIMRAVMPVVLGSLLPPDEPDRAHALDAGVVTLDEYVASLSVSLQTEAGNVFSTLDLMPMRIVLLGTTSGWGEMSPDTVESFLRSARTSRIELLRRMYTFLQSMAVLAWFDQRAAWPGIGYPGPPIVRPVAFGGLT
jgi:hypothetical protein